MSRWSAELVRRIAKSMSLEDSVLMADCINAECDQYEERIFALSERLKIAEAPLGGRLGAIVAQKEEFESKLFELKEAIQKQHAEIFYVTAARALGVGFDACTANDKSHVEAQRRKEEEKK